MIDPLALLLSRIQFAFTIGVHIIFPAITIGLASYLAVLEGLWLYSKKNVYRDLYHFWSKIFAVNFGMGVVSGLVMAYQFGTNWSGFSTFAGGITGPLLTYEVLTAFFLEAGFLGVMLFGWNRVGNGLHFFSTLMVASGTLLSTFWILASNSWMQTPQGFEIINNHVVPVSWPDVIFNPSFPYRLAHMSIAAFLSTALFVGASAAWHLLRKHNTEAIRKMFSMAMWMLVIVTPIQIFVGDLHGLNTLEYQPVKVAAMEGHWEKQANYDGEGLPLLLFGWPDMEDETTHFSLAIPHLGSLILTHSWDGTIPGLKDFPADERPPVAWVFWSFRVMVGLGMLMLVLGVVALWKRWRGRLYDSPLFLRFALLMGPAGLIALLAGWFTTEIGRQPWIVYGVMRTSEAVSPHSAATMALSLGLFVVVYLFSFGIGILYMLRLVAKGPHYNEGALESHGGPGQDRQPMRPLSAVEERLDEINDSSTTEET